MGPSGALTRRSKTGASTLFQRARVILLLPNTTSVNRNFSVIQGMVATEGATRICKCSIVMSVKPSSLERNGRNRRSREGGGPCGSKRRPAQRHYRTAESEIRDESWRDF